MALENVIKSYKLGLKALDEIEEFINTYGNDCKFIRRDTLLYTSKESEVGEMKEEYKYLVLVDIEKSEKEILKNIILLQKYVIEALMVKIEKANFNNLLYNRILIDVINFDCFYYLNIEYIILFSANPVLVFIFLLCKTASLDIPTFSKISHFICVSFLCPS